MLFYLHGPSSVLCTLHPQPTIPNPTAQPGSPTLAFPWRATAFSWAQSSRPPAFIPHPPIYGASSKSSGSKESKSVVFLFSSASNPSTSLVSHSSFRQVLSLAYTPVPLLCQPQPADAKASGTVSKGPGHLFLTNAWKRSPNQSERKSLK